MDDFEQNLTKKERKALRREKKKNEQTKKSRGKVIKRIIIWFFVISIISGSIFLLVIAIKNAPSTDMSGSIPTVLEDDWIKGNIEAENTLVEYSDFQCPACRAYYDILKQLNEDLRDDVKIVYRHFPLKRIHANAKIAAKASEAAGRQNKFWEMHDMLFENQERWSNLRNTEKTFIEYADDLELDIDRFKNDLDSNELDEKIERHLNNGIKAGINSTPTFYLNGKKISNPRTYEEFKKLILDNIDESGQ